MPDDRRIIIAMRPVTQGQAPRQGAQLVRRRLDRIDARNILDFEFVAFKLRNERPESAPNDWKARWLRRKLGQDMRSQRAMRV